jgi:hypothetical protein
MFFNMHPKKVVKIVFCILLLQTMMPNFTSLNAQVQSHQSTVIDYLSRMAQKGKIEFNDFIKPIDRKIIFQKLTELQNQKDLSVIEQKELQFFIAGFVLENPTIIHIGSSLTDTSFGKNGNSGPQFFSFKKLKTNPTVQQNLITYKENGFGLIVNPMGNLTMQSRNGKINTIQGRGFQLAGYAGKRIGFQLSFMDINEQGRYDSLRLDNELPGFVKKGTTNPKILNYSQMNATLSYRLNKGMITVGQDQQVMGYGRSGNIVLSDKAPAYPFYALNYQPSTWLKFNYMHAWLQSGVLDTRATYDLNNMVYGGVRQQYLPKFFATHSVEIAPMKGLKINLGESIMYSENLQLAYMLPVTFFKAFDNQKFADNILTGSNGQFFFGFSSRNQLPNTHLYGQWMIDEIRLSTAFNSGKSRNQLGYQLGASVTDLFMHYLTLNAEYTRLNPFMYRNFIAAQNYSNANYSLGDWMGSNADRILLSAKYHPKANLSLEAFAFMLRKNGEASIEAQYFAEPQPKFGFNPQYRRTKMGLNAKYELWNNLMVNFSYANTFQKPTIGKGKWFSDLSLGVCWNKF